MELFNRPHIILLCWFLILLAWQYPVFASNRQMIWIGYETNIKDDQSAIVDHQIRHYISNELRDVDIQIEAANTPRTEKLLQSVANVCASGMHYTNSRKAFSYSTRLLSLSTLIDPPIVGIIDPL